jgi:aspartate racemase
MKHIGIIAHSAEGAALCYRTVCQEGFRRLGEHQHPDITMSSIAMGKCMPHWESNEMDPIAKLLLLGACRVAAAGAEFVILPDNTAHLAIEHVRKQLPIPLLHIADAVCRNAKERGFVRLGILGTKYTMNGSIYRDATKRYGIGTEVPPAEQQHRLNTIIFDELVNGIFTNDSLEYYKSAIRQLSAAGCDAVVLGCTEIPLLVPEKASPLPTLDSTRLLAQEAVAFAIDGDSSLLWQ